MASSIHDFRRSKLFRAAIIVPTIIALIFSIFNLTAPNDPEEISPLDNAIVAFSESLNNPTLNGRDLEITLIA